MNNLSWVSVAVLFAALTVLNVLAWRNIQRVQDGLDTCVREYRLLLEEHPCPAR